MNRAFTLIELLVVVAIIGILASIAIPNFLCAQVRAKIARTEADHKTLSTALEMYRLDNNGHPNLIGFVDNKQFQRLIQLTTPVSYLGSILFDPFYAPQPDDENAVYEDGAYPFWNPDFTDDVKNNTNKFDLFRDEGERQQRWTLHGAGPDGDYEATQPGPMVWYAATNGCVSNGDIYRFGL